MVLEGQQSAEAEGFDTFVKLTEEARRERTRRLDAGDETAKLNFTRPEVLPPPGKGVPLPPQQALAPQKGGKPYYTPRSQTPYSGSKGGGYCWGSKAGGGGYSSPGAPPPGGKGYGGARGPTGGYKGSSTYGKSYGK